ncbi:hypothetical protein WMW72_08250 [Paenibacillus filicis]|uniref:Uncharacterized protein n=1 Tax=Paenibacillus filicis TaxID=669464 RepID=A0ABU9DIA2_9BACL
MHQKNIVVCVMIGLPDETPTAETRSFPTTTKHLYEMLRWMESKGVGQVSMEEQVYIRNKRCWLSAASSPSRICIQVAFIWG